SPQSRSGAIPRDADGSPAWLCVPVTRSRLKACLTVRSMRPLTMWWCARRLRQRIVTKDKTPVTEARRKVGMKPCRYIVFTALLLLAESSFLHAETGYEAWLRYAPLEERMRARYASLPASMLVLGESEIMDSAHNELVRGLRGMLGRRLRAAGQIQEPTF